MAPMNWWPSWQAWAQRPHRMQSAMAMLNTGLLSSTASRSRADQRGRSRSWCLAAMVSSRWSLRLGSGRALPPLPLLPTMAWVNSNTPRRILRTWGVSIQTSIPSVAGTEQDAGKPLVPSICTMQVRQAPMGFMSGSLQSCETYVPDELMASRTEAPSGTSTSPPFICSVMVMVAFRQKSYFRLAVDAAPMATPIATPNASPDAYVAHGGAESHADTNPDGDPEHEVSAPLVPSALAVVTFTVRSVTPGNPSATPPQPSAPARRRPFLSP